MVIKTLSRKSGSSQLINYLFKSERKHGNDKPIVIRHNIRSRSIKGYIKEFEKNAEGRIHKRKDAVAVHHSILSFNKLDKEHINEKVLRSMAKKYIELRGLNNLYVITSHHDRSHIHIHVAMSGTQLNGLASRISRQEFADIKLEMDRYQMKQFPELIHSLPKHGRSKQTVKEKEVQPVKNNGRESQKESLLQCLETAYTGSKSIEGFLNTLKSQGGYEAYYRAGRLTGVRSESGLKFRLSRLGYDKEKIAKLDALQKEQKELSELRELREGRSSQRDEDDERSSRSDARDIEDDVDDKDGHSQISEEDTDDEAAESDDIDNVDDTNIS